MEHEHAWCASCAVVFSRQLIEKAGTAQLMLDDGIGMRDVRCAAVNGLLTFLVPNASQPARRVVDGGLVAQVSVNDSDQHDVSLRLFGWIERVQPSRQAQVANAFADRHLTTDLLDVGVSWTLLQLDVAEAQLHCEGNSLVMGPDQLQVALSLFGTR